MKQGSSDEEVEDKEFVSDLYQTSISLSLFDYTTLLKEGVCPEMARMVLPQSTYTEWWWSGSLAAFARVCKLRLDTHTQKETRDVAQLMSDELEKLFPVSWKALMEND